MSRDGTQPPKGQVLPGVAVAEDAASGNHVLPSLLSSVRARHAFKASGGSAGLPCLPPPPGRSRLTMSGMWQSMRMTSKLPAMHAATAFLPLSTISYEHPRLRRIRVATIWFTPLSCTGTRAGTESGRNSRSWCYSGAYHSAQSNSVVDEQKSHLVSTFSNFAFYGTIGMS